MFCVIFEVRPRTVQWGAYLDTAKLLRPELEAVDGFIDNIRYRSLTREGWILSLSSWRDEKSLVRWRTGFQHHLAQEKGRGEIFADYRLRVGQVTLDTRMPEGHALVEQRLDETETGDATTVSLVTAKRTIDLAETATPLEIARYLGLEESAQGLAGWEVFNAVLTPDDLILRLSWRDRASAEKHEKAVSLRGEARLRIVRVVRDYGMLDRREAPQYYPAVVRE